MDVLLSKTYRTTDNDVFVSVQPQEQCGVTLLSPVAGGRGLQVTVSRLHSKR